MTVQEGVVVVSKRERLEAPEPLHRADMERLLAVFRDAKVKMAEPESVTEYLFAHSAVAATLPFVIGEARDRLGADAQVSLEVDEPAGFGCEYLVLRIRQEPYMPEILDIVRDMTDVARSRMPIPDYQFIITSDFARPS